MTSDWDASWVHSFGGFLSMTNWGETLGQNLLEELHAPSGRGMLWDLPGGVGNRCWGEGCLEYPE